MPRQPRVDIAGEIYHVINRANARQYIFNTDEDYRAVFSALEETLKKIPLDIFSFCIMSNHWHFAVRPREDGDMGRFFGKFTQVVTQRWHAFRHTSGTGHLFQGRYKSFLVQNDSYFIQLMRYIEANPLRAKLVRRAEEWKWGSLYLRLTSPDWATKLLAPWPVEALKDYLEDVNRPLPEAVLKQLRNSVSRGTPFGEAAWLQGMVEKYGLECTIRPRGGQTKSK